MAIEFTNFSWPILQLTTELEEVVAGPSTPIAVSEDEGLVVDSDVKTLLDIVLADIEKMVSALRIKKIYYGLTFISCS